MKTAYEDVPLAPQSTVAQELVSCSLEEELGLLTDQEDDTNMGLSSKYPSSVNDLLSARYPENFSRDVLDIGSREAAGHAKYYVTIKNMATKDFSMTEEMTERSPRLLQEFESEYSRILEGIYEQIGSQRVSRNKIDFAASRVIDEAFRSEHTSNW